MYSLFYFSGLLWSLVPIVAIVLAWRASKRSKKTAERLKFAEEHIERLEQNIGLSPNPDLTQSKPTPETETSTETPTTPEPDTTQAQPAKTESVETSVPSVTSTLDEAQTIAADDRASSSPEPSFEERLGTKWAVYVGGLALAIGGVLLVRYTIEAGLIGPAARIALGGIFAALLLAAGEWWRRRDLDLGIQEKFAAHIPSVLTAAGTIAAFATVYAAYAAYSFISGGVAFVALGVIAIATMLAAALHGPTLAALGIVGSHITPLLVSSQTPNPWALVLYLAMLTAAALVLAKLRHWWWLVLANTVGVVIWGLVLSSGSYAAEQLWATTAFTHVVLQSLLAAVILVFLPYLNRRDEDAQTDWVGFGTLAALTGLSIMAQQIVSFDMTFWLLAALAMIVLLTTTGFFNAVVAGATALAGLIIVTTLYIWSDQVGDIVPRMPPTLFVRLPEDVSSFLQFATLSSLGLTAVTAYRLYRGPNLQFLPALSYAIAMTSPILLALALSYLRVTHFDFSLPFGLVGAALAALFAVLADRFDARGKIEENRVGHMVASIAAVGAVGALSFALVTCLGRGYLTMAFALTAFGAAYVAVKRDMPILRYIIIPIGLIVLGRLIWDPRIMGDAVGNWPIFNWLLVGYGVPALAFGGAAWMLGRKGVDDVTVKFAQALAIVFAAFLAFFEIRHYVHDGNILASTTGHLEMGLFALTSLGFSYAISRLFDGTKNIVFSVARIAFAVLTGLLAVIGLLGTQNPYFSSELVTGGAILSSLLPAYLLPGLFALYVAKQLRDEPQNKYYALFAACLGLVLVFSYVTLEVRHLFHGERINMRISTTDAEMWAYNISWLVLAIVFLGYGLVRQSLPARIASAGLLTATVLKIGLYDLAELTGLWRALSFICLGAVLIGIGLVYQRLIFAKPRAPNTKDENKVDT
ncbi:MAG: DUF2339 domain-containing protein [Hyphomicrobiaceae bacterium]